MTQLIEHAFTSSVEQSEQLANAVAANLAQIIEKQGRAVLAVSGGRSPIPFFTTLSKKPLDWDKVTITLVDERIVETTHQDSNTALVREHLLVNLAAKASYHAILADNLDDDALHNDIELAANANSNFQQPDIIILGMGEDAHTASLFPFVADLLVTASIISVTPSDAPYQRLSLSLNAILAAKMIYLGIGGENKMAVYQQAKAEKTPQMPISYVLHQSTTPVEVFYHG